MPFLLQSTSSQVNFYFFQIDIFLYLKQLKKEFLVDRIHTYYH